MMFGPTFGGEAIAAGLGGLPFSWDEDGTIRGRESLTSDQNAVLDAVIAAHDRTKQIPHSIDGAVFLSRITDAEYTAVTTSTNVSVLRWVETLRMKGVVNLGDATAIAAKAGLVALGLMTQQRADEVFAP